MINDRLFVTDIECCLSRCTVLSTVVGHHTDVVLLIVEHRELDGSIWGDENRL